MSASANTAVEPTLLEAWQRHVLQCNECARAANGEALCTMGKNFWRIPGSATMPVVATPIALVPQPLQAQAQRQPQLQHDMDIAVSHSQHTQQPAFDLSVLSSRVSERVIARTSTGAAIGVPTEKTSRSVEIRTSADVTLRMPERDIEVYTAMKSSIGRFLRLAEVLGTCILASDEAKKMARTAGVVLADREMALVVHQAAQARGMSGITQEALFNEFCEVTMVAVRLGDAIGRFMMVDNETREVMREVRRLGVDMQSEMERSSQEIVLDGEMRKITRALRLVAVSLQGEIERRLGT